MKSQSKIYLNVPYAQKDAAKALGATWDPTHKKWYVPANLDIFLFDAWRLDTVNSMDSPVELIINKVIDSSVVANRSATAGVFTYPIDKNFVAYDGDQPPWG